MIDTSEIEQIRSDVEDLLPDTGRVLVHSPKSDGAGGQEETYTPGAELPCAIAPVGQGRGLSTAGDRINEASTHIATFPAATAIRSVDRVEVDGTVYAVTTLRERGAMSMTKRVEVKAL